MRAEFSLACIAHNLKMIWKIQGEMEGIGVNSTKNGRFDLDLGGGKNGMVQLVWEIAVRLSFMSESLRREACASRINSETGSQGRGGTKNITP